MACFLVPVGEAAVVTVLERMVARRAKRTEKEHTAAQQAQASAEQEVRTLQSHAHLRLALVWSRRLRWLSAMLWGGGLLLALEHVWHGEIVPWPPFLTAMQNPLDIGPMLHEMVVYGGTMVALVTACWGVLVAFEAVLRRRKSRLMPMAFDSASLTVQTISVDSGVSQKEAR